MTTVAPPCDLPAFCSEGGTEHPDAPPIAGVVPQQAQRRPVYTQEAVPAGVPQVSGEYAVGQQFPDEADSEKEDEFAFDREELFQHRRYYANFMFTGAQILETPEKVANAIRKNTLHVFQESDSSAPGDMTQRKGAVDRTIVRDLAVHRVKSNFPLPLGLMITDREEGRPSIRGNGYDILTGERIAYMIFPHQNDTPNQTIHRAKNSIEGLVRAYGATSKEKLYDSLMKPSAKEDRDKWYYVPVNHEISDICRKNARLVGFEIDNMPIIDENYVKLPVPVVERIAKRILATVEDIQPFDLTKFQAKLTPVAENGLEDAMMMLTCNDEGMMETLKDKVYQVNLEFEMVYAPITEEEDFE